MQVLCSALLIILRERKCKYVRGMSILGFCPLSVKGLIHVLDIYKIPNNVIRLLY